ncbi:metalloregulator ArsR/SmtB family transcription factor [Hyphomicrobium sp. xq]|uniref:Metalloregulator ArsR/SmtB family transcription factor n=1 Tax=Hyphomicrobium album TaxID=2665159 RepID=A0A6I3KM48_9HYPH|nr:metalloregulator ArsR/SmtB family transcription factor [Hyphomicrobium album]MTD93791.1 metalloregulator ArsR/SmtB family transcription factor [Hyphomicrobium album]
MLKHSPIDDSFRALAEPTRRALIERLTQGPASVSDLAKPFAMTLAAVVQHLQVLEAGGFIRSEKIGRVRTCRLEQGGFAPLANWIAARRMLMERRFDRLGVLLAEEEAAEQVSRSAAKPKKQRRRRAKE